MNKKSVESYLIDVIRAGDGQIKQTFENAMNYGLISDRLNEVPDDLLVKVLERANYLYRQGRPFMSDYVYSNVLLAALQKRSPEHPYLHEVEPEPAEQKTVPLPEKMLSTDKAYTMKEVEVWIARVHKASTELGQSPAGVVFEVTPKLDGFAAYDDGERLYTRGNGVRGTDISHVFERGLNVDGAMEGFERGRGPGELVVNTEYFQEHLSGEFDNPRNALASVIKTGDLAPSIQEALDNRKILFCPFDCLPAFRLETLTLKENLELAFDHFKRTARCEIDGVVISVEDSEVRKKMGSTSHHHRWQIAYKRNEEFAETTIESITPQTSKDGRITPVAELKPVYLSGAEIRRATCHHYANVLAEGLGAGARVQIVRSGLVIPKIEEVIKPAESTELPETCPSCGSPTEIRGLFLHCTNTADCPAQAAKTMEYFFKTLGVCDGFGPEVTKTLCDAGIDTVQKVYYSSVTDLISAGIGTKTAQNLMNELNASTIRDLEDWRFLAAFSIPGIGKGGCEKLLQHHRLKDIFDLSESDLIKIDGFAEKTAKVFVATLRRIRSDFTIILRFYNQLIETPLASEQVTDSPISGKSIVFTGAMKKGKREEMKKQARDLGAKTPGSVSKTTDYLVCGDNVGATKIAAARDKGVTILTEELYLKLLED